ncbi:MAG: CHAD domain-containing protein [Ignavibacteria bacterium]|nr:CHAD domain-containing protein [Ignavibacteria bacterium]
MTLLKLKELEKYLYNRKLAIEFILEKPRKKFSASTFHKLRVEIKKLNALFDLLSTCTESFNRKKTFKPFKIIFRQAGIVRELQLEETLLKNFKLISLLSDYMISIRKNRLTEQRVFFSMIDIKMNDRIKNKYKLIVPFLSSVNKLNSENYLNEKTISIKKIINRTNIQAEQIHELRKLLKMVSYIRKCLSSEKYNDPESKNHKLSGLLGKWHDLQVMIRHLNKAIDTGEINKDEIILLKKIKAKISSDSYNLFEKIKKAISESEFFTGNKQQYMY